MKLTKVPYSLNKSESAVVAMGNINYSDMIKDGDFADSKNISARRYPYITTKSAETIHSTGATSLYAQGKLLEVRSEQGAHYIYYDGKIANKKFKHLSLSSSGGYVKPIITEYAPKQVAEGEKQFVTINTKIVVFPDKLYLDLTQLDADGTPLVYDLDGELVIKPTYSNETTSNIDRIKFTENAIQISRDYTLAKTDWVNDFTFSGLSEGDLVTVYSSSKNGGVEFRIKSISELRIEATESVFEEDETTFEVTIRRTIPDMDYICSSENRLWGCSSEKQTIYASALGEPTNFNKFEAISTDSYAVAVGTSEPFTGCIGYSSSVLFFKENCLHKILGSYPSEYTLYTYNIDGVALGSSKSLQIINETLFYMGIRGVFEYNGSVPLLISSNFGDKNFTDAIAGSDNDSYYLSVKENEKSHLFVYELKNGVWVREGDTRCVSFAHIGKDLYYADSQGNVHLIQTRADDPNVEWYALFTPFYETISGRKAHSKISLRLELEKGSYVSVLLRRDAGSWKKAGTIIGKKEGSVAIRIPITRCDKFEIRLEGKGSCTILSMLREFALRSDV